MSQDLGASFEAFICILIPEQLRLQALPAQKASMRWLIFPAPDCLLRTLHRFRLLFDSRLIFLVSRQSILVFVNILQNYLAPICLFLFLILCKEPCLVFSRHKNWLLCM